MSKKRKGRPRAYTPEAFLKKCYEYIELTKQKTYDIAVLARGETVALPKKYPVNIYDFCFFAGINRDTYFEYRKQKEYQDCFAVIDTYIKSVQYSGAITGEFNSNFVARINDVAEHVKSNITEEKIIKVKFGE
ncbi:MAG: DNA-packaging protein [Tannerellaceae bacterium]|nr:DNA-packaging protein [Tannerellaceae bacterium]